MRRQLNVGLLCGAVLLGCGAHNDPSPPAGGDQDAPYAPCGERPPGSAITTIDLRVNSPVPAELDTACAQGDLLRLDAFLSVPEHPTCLLTVQNAAASGCCPGVAAGASYAVTLVYRDAPRRLPLAEQNRSLSLPAGTPPVVDLSFAGRPADESFYDTDGDQIGNRTEWCAGTL